MLDTRAWLVPDPPVENFQWMTEFETVVGRTEVTLGSRWLRCPWKSGFEAGHVLKVHAVSDLVCGVTPSQNLPGAPLHMLRDEAEGFHAILMSIFVTRLVFHSSRERWVYVNMKFMFESKPVGRYRRKFSEMATVQGVCPLFCAARPQSRDEKKIGNI